MTYCYNDEMAKLQALQSTVLTVNAANINWTGLRLMDLYYNGWTDPVPQKAPAPTLPKLILLLLVSTDTWQITKCVRVQRLREGSKMEVIVTRWYVSWSNF